MSGLQNLFEQQLVVPLDPSLQTSVLTIEVSSPSLDVVWIVVICEYRYVAIPAVWPSLIVIPPETRF
jgi:hypothetical protein